jgi:hypothetical protein
VVSCPLNAWAFSALDVLPPRTARTAISGAGDEREEPNESEYRGDDEEPVRGEANADNHEKQQRDQYEQNHDDPPRDQRPEARTEFTVQFAFGRISNRGEELTL